MTDATNAEQQDAPKIKSGIDIVGIRAAEAETKRAIEEKNLAIAKEMQAQKRRQAQLEKLAETDPLTGLLNKRGFEKRLLSEAKKAKRLGYSIYLVSFDLNGLKEVNDTRGHEAGDEKIKDAAAVLSSNHSIRAETDFAAHPSGDEFWVVLAEKPGDNPRQWWYRLKPHIKENNLSISAGCAKLELDNGFSVVDLKAAIKGAKHKADQNMYAAKRQVKKTPGETSLMVGGQ